MKLHTWTATAAMIGILGGCASSPTAEQQARMAAQDRLQDADRIVQARIVESTASIANTLQMIERIERGDPPARSMSSLFGQVQDQGPTQMQVQMQMGARPAGLPSTAASSLFGQVQDQGPTQMQGLMQMGARPSGLPSTAVSSSGPQGQSGYGPDVLDSRLRVQWRNGSAEELLRTLAKQMNVPFKVTGERRPIPVVSVSFENESMHSILTAVGRQVDREADVVLSRIQPQPVLELRFK